MIWTIGSNIRIEFSDSNFHTTEQHVLLEVMMFPSVSSVTSNGFLGLFVHCKENKMPDTCLKN